MAFPKWEGLKTLLSTMETPADKSIHIYDANVHELPVSTPNERIRHARARSGLSITRLAQLMDIHPDYYRLFEKNFIRSNPNTLRRFSTVTNTDLSWIVYGESPPPAAALSAPTVGQRIKEFRTQRDLTKRQLSADVFNVPKKPSILCWESDQYTPEFRTLLLIANTYGVDVSSFIP